MAVSGDAGALDPQLSPSNILNQLNQFTYDSLVSINADDGSIASQLASEWTVEDLSLTFTLNDGITCSDGSDFTAETAVKNIEFVADPANESPFLGVYVPGGATAAAEGNVVTVTLAAPAPFAINGFASLPMVCDAGMDDRSTLTSGTNGTGPYELTEAVPNDHYTYAVREGYTWGPDGATTAEKGLPASVVVRVIENDTTAASLILSGEVNAGGIVGSDAKRLESANLFSVPNDALFGQQWYNQGEGRATNDPAVRMALSQSVDLTELAKVATGGTGTPSTTFAVVAPVACPGDSISGALPAFDVDAAATLLDDAGWIAGSDGKRAKDGTPLAVKFLYNSAMGPEGTAAAEYAAKQWEALGITVDVLAQDSTALQTVIFTPGGDWDITWIALNVSSPDQLIGFMSGDAPTNFAHIDNDAYTAGVADASTMIGSEGCPTWLDAESNLVADADVIPFANTVLNTFGNGAEFTMSGSITPTSVRMLG